MMRDMPRPESVASASAKAAAIHRDAIVVDTAYADPSVHLPDLIARANDRWDRGDDPAEVIAEFDRDCNQSLWTREDAGEQYRGKLASAGVTLGAVTVGGAGWTFQAAVRDIGSWRERFDHLPERVVPVLAPHQVPDVKASRRLGVVFQFQNTTHFEDDLRNVDAFFGLGVRIVQLTYNDRNSVGCGCTESNDDGLTPFGRDLLGRLNERGIVVDLSHCGSRTTADTMQTSRSAPCVTHAACSAVATHPRNKSDEQIRAIADRGGYFGVAILPMFLTGRPGATSDDFFAHLLHAIDVAGIDHVGVGMDWPPQPPPFAQRLYDRVSLWFESQARIGPAITLGGTHRAETTGIDGARGWPNITQGLVERGFSDEDVRKVLGLNFVRYWERVAAGGG
jgi:membrane dipeptidase